MSLSGSFFGIPPSSYLCKQNRLNKLNKTDTDRVGHCRSNSLPEQALRSGCLKRHPGLMQEQLTAVGDLFHFFLCLLGTVPYISEEEQG